MKKSAIVAAMAAIALVSGAHAATANGSQFTNGLNAQTIDGIDFSAIGGSFQKKAAGPLMGVGIAGQTGGEIDIKGEAIVASFAAMGAQHVGSFTLGLLYNGPEYNDVLEVAKITVNNSQTFYLRTTAAENQAQWFDGATLLGTVNYLHGTQSGVGAVVKVDNPFGALAVTSLKFEADPGQNLFRCGSGGIKSCSNQSDYNLVQISTTPVPEPGTYALMFAGLAAIGTVVRRQRKTA